MDKGKRGAKEGYARRSVLHEDQVRHQKKLEQNRLK